MDGAWEDLLKLIEHRELSRAEIIERLRRKGHTVRASEAAVRKARRLGLMDERRLAVAIAGQEAEGAPRGVLRVQADLERRAVSERVAGQTLEGVDDLGRCRKAVSRHVAKHGPPSTPQDFRRLATWLARRGHLEDSVREVLQDLGLEWPDA
ncbi:Regulatory protein RecX [mine drainage metagenome]|uniref:Regulatory protein RecX n=1 Tax=mine drainage metagenome TaxID=410659 RepID=T0Z9P2_9ZZZZ